ncbi:MAG: hypothetical protein U1E42_13190 [Rhodospirillales bacterium]
MHSGTDQAPVAGSASWLRLDRAVSELEAAATQFAKRSGSVAHSDAEVERLRSLNEAVSARLDALIARLRDLLRE